LAFARRMQKEAHEREARGDTNGVFNPGKEGTIPIGGR
jgi:hypothetical protein